MNWRIEFSNNPYRDRGRHHDCCSHHNRPRVSIESSYSSPSPVTYNTMPMSYNTMPMMGDSFMLDGALEDIFAFSAVQDVYADAFRMQQMEYDIIMSTPIYDHRLGRWVLPNPYVGQGSGGDGVSYSQGAGNYSGYRNFGSHPLYKAVPGTMAHDAVDRERRRQLFEGENYFTALAYNESYNEKTGYNYRAISRNPDGRKFYGKYQMGVAALQTAGFIDENGKWTGKMGVNSPEDYLNNPEAQEVAVKEFTESNWKTIKKLKLDRFIDTQRFGVTITKTALLGAAHIGGVNGVKRLLENDKDPADKNGTRISTYLYELSGTYDPLGIS